MLESRFKRKLIAEIKERFPFCMVFHLDPGEMQGVPDLLILHHDKWAMLEGKKEKNSPHQPNQDYYVDQLDAMSFARFVYPENMEEVLDELQQTFGNRRRVARISKRL